MYILFSERQEEYHRRILQKNAAFFKSVVEKTEERIGSSKADKETHIILLHTVSKKVPDFLFCWKEQQTSRHDDDEKNRKNHKKS